ncbi:MAG: V-type ATP synthase subunit E family protein [Methanophagales archaeon]|nr:V-type ATP synthase subunit E family protein [Methanophagales archaeon]MCW3139514.1 V-type ATP synthase subunit E family protein [Methanophagales archaeon]MCW7069398.1 V-type ATP synthase subunit E family protein [Methanophagales archaeon]MCW7072794.1 V-type ATP synthase subunit E family protein [Methanophagales archaeon]
MHVGASEIVERIKAEAREEQERILREARAQVENRIKNAKADIEERKKRFIETERRKAAENKDRIIRAKRLDAKKFKWDVEEKAIKRALEEALKRVQHVKKEGFRGKSYPSILAGLIKDAALSITAGSERSSSELEVVLSAEDAQFVTEDMLKEVSGEAGGEVRLSEERIKTAGGVIVRRSDGKIEVNNTFEERMKRFYPELREDIVKVLFHDRKE